MKNLSLILNGILFLAVIALYVLFFTGKESSNADQSDFMESSTQAMNDGKIVFINLDSVSYYYEMYQDVVGNLEEKIKLAEAQLQSKQKTFQENLNDYQNKAQRGLITRREAQEIEEKLAQEQQNLQALQNQLQYELAEEQQVAQNKVFYSIKVYLQNMKGADNIKFVLADGTGSNIMYANESYDITKKVIEGLNEEYQKNKEKE